jgi:hypothetical protein
MKDLIHTISPCQTFNGTSVSGYTDYGEGRFTGFEVMLPTLQLSKRLPADKIAGTIGICAT